MMETKGKTKCNNTLTIREILSITYQCSRYKRIKQLNGEYSESHEHNSMSLQLYGRRARRQVTVMM